MSSQLSNVSNVIDFDSSVPASVGTHFDFRELQDKIRFSCSWRTAAEIENLFIKNNLPQSKITFLGSGDFHHLSYFLLKLLGPLEPVHVVVFDNHPDNMLFPWGLHCGSWVYHASKLSSVAHITMVGMTSGDMNGWHVLEHHASVLRSRKVSYLTFANPSSLLKSIAGSAVVTVPPDARGNPVELVKLIRAQSNGRIYISIDKDVLAKEEIVTNWDQGKMKASTLIDCLTLLKTDVIAGDVTGEISFHKYKSVFKRLLSSMDEQSLPDMAKLVAHQKEHENLNLEIMKALSIGAVV